jgi:hypothetical protein
VAVPERRREVCSLRAEPSVRSSRGKRRPNDELDPSAVDRARRCVLASSASALLLAGAVAASRSVRGRAAIPLDRWA